MHRVLAAGWFISVKRFHLHLRDEGLPVADGECEQA